MLQSKHHVLRELVVCISAKKWCNGDHVPVIRPPTEKSADLSRLSISRWHDFHDLKSRYIRPTSTTNAANSMAPKSTHIGKFLRFLQDSLTKFSKYGWLCRRILVEFWCQVLTIFSVAGHDALTICRRYATNILTPFIIVFIMLRVALYSTMLAVAMGQGYGPLYPTKDMTTGLELLNLPEGFSYMSYGKSS